MVNSFFKSEDDKTLKERFNSKWREYIRQAENTEPSVQEGESNDG